jgi:hypothetical protein
MVHAIRSDVQYVYCLVDIHMFQWPGLLPIRLAAGHPSGSSPAQTFSCKHQLLTTNYVVAPGVLLLLALASALLPALPALPSRATERMDLSCRVTTLAHQYKWHEKAWAYCLLPGDSVTCSFSPLQQLHTAGSYLKPADLLFQ